MTLSDIIRSATLRIYRPALQGGTIYACHSSIRVHCVPFDYLLCTLCSCPYCGAASSDGTTYKCGTVITVIDARDMLNVVSPRHSAIMAINQIPNDTVHINYQSMLMLDLSLEDDVI